MDKFNMRKNKNRRGAFRIYDEVNLSYEKVDQQWIADHPLSLGNALNDHSFSTDIERPAENSASLLPGQEHNLPGSQFNEHESRDVNISSTGMAFNCDDTLNEGDFLAIKIQLEAGTTVIVTYSQVVYCKHLQSDASPNDSPHPCFVGTHFVNMKDEDRELLSRHVDKKRKLQTRINGVLLAILTAIIVAPDLVFSLLLGLVHFLAERSFELIHITFEFVELSLDHLVEHLFHTDLHQTQIIVFYIMLSFAVYGLYLVWRTLPSFYRRCKRSLFKTYIFKKAGVQFFWRELSLLNKTKIVVIGIVVIASYFFFGI